jgi:hypothetical protein
MKIILKYTLDVIPDMQAIEMAIDAKFLAVQMQYSKITLWMVETAGESLRQKFYFTVLGTGQKFEQKDCEYLGTVQNGLYVWHIFYNAPVK